MTHRILLSVLLLLMSFPLNAQTILSDEDPLQNITIYFSQVLNERSYSDVSDAGLSNFAGLLASQGATIRVLHNLEMLPDDADLIISSTPTRDMSNLQVAAIIRYIQDGGAFLLFIDPIDDLRSDIVYVNGAFRSSRLFFQFTRDLGGFYANDDLIGTEGEGGNFTVDFETPLLNEAHPIVQNLSELGITEPDLFIQGARSLSLENQLTGYGRSQVLIRTPQGYYGETDLRTWVDSDESEYTPEGTIADRFRGIHAIAMTFEHFENNGRIALFGDAGLIHNGQGMRTSPSGTTDFVYPNNVRLMLSTVAWMVERPVVEMNITEAQNN